VHGVVAEWIQIVGARITGDIPMSLQLAFLPSSLGNSKRLAAAAILMACAGGVMCPGTSGQEATKARRDPLKELIDSFRPEFVRAPDIGLWFFRAGDRELIVSDVAAEGVITRAGFQEGDRLVSVNGHRVATETDFIRSVFSESTRDRGVKVIVLRDDKEQVLNVHPALLIEELSVARGEPLEPMGIILDDRERDQVLVWKVLPYSPAFYAGLHAGDKITACDGQQLPTPTEFSRLVYLKRTPSVTLDVLRRGQVRQFAAQPHLASRAGEGTRPDLPTAHRPRRNFGRRRTAARRSPRAATAALGS
jgi:S1-C subfamily serine protease